MSMTYHERPGVYSDYDASSVAATSQGRRIVAVAAQSDAADGLYTVTSAAEARSVFGEQSQMTQMLETLFANGASMALAVPVRSDSDYPDAFTLLLEQKSASLCIAGSMSEDVQLGMRDAVMAASGQRGECIGIVAMNKPSSGAMLARAKQLNCERMVLVGPDLYPTGGDVEVGAAITAAAFAGIVAAQSDPALPLHGAVLTGFSGVTASYDDATLDSLVQGGVSILEAASGGVRVVRSVTTRTTTGDVPDKTYRELNTMLIIDDVIPAIRTALAAKFARVKNNALTRSAIRSQVIVELDERVRREIIDSYDNVTVTADPSEPTVCLVEFDFAVVHGLSRIYLTAHISV